MRTENKIDLSSNKLMNELGLFDIADQSIWSISRKGYHFTIQATEDDDDHKRVTAQVCWHFEVQYIGDIIADYQGTLGQCIKLYISAFNLYQSLDFVPEVKI